MVFYSGDFQGDSFNLKATASQDAALFDVLNGMGGPEETENVFLTFEESVSALLTKPNTSVFGESVSNHTPVVTKTQTVNYMKVANTTWPVDVPETTSLYGWRTPPCKGCSADHKGVDFVPGYGAPVYAVTDGMVTNISEGGSGYGVYIVLNHLVANAEGEIDEWQTLYAHLKTGSIPRELKIGSVVQKGEVIGKVGSTGLSTGPHLHFELLINGEHVDPMPLLGTYIVLTVIEEDSKDALRLGETFTTRTEILEYR
jgi:murein DD-endopeptidase MepM/ murein hydrolase activator NlpD